MSARMSSMKNVGVNLIINKTKEEITIGYFSFSFF